RNLVFRQNRSRTIWRWWAIPRMAIRVCAAGVQSHRLPSLPNSSSERNHALLFRTLATLRTDLALFEDVDQLRWKGPTSTFDEVAARLDAARTEKRRPSDRRGSSAPLLKSVARR